MKRLIRLSLLILVCLTGSSCIKEKLETIYSSQESKIDTYLAKFDSTMIFRNGGSNRLTKVKGDGERLEANGMVSFYYAGYIFTNGAPSKANLFVTNHRETADQAGWTLTDEQFTVYEVNMEDASLLEGLRKGLLGVQPGEECEIVFSGKYGFGKKSFGMIPANSALLYKIWVAGVAND